MRARNQEVAADFRRFWQANPEAVETIPGTACFKQRFVGSLDDGEAFWAGIVARFEDVANRRGMDLLAPPVVEPDGDGFVVFAVAKRR